MGWGVGASNYCCFYLFVGAENESAINIISSLHEHMPVTHSNAHIKLPMYLTRI